MSPFIPRPGVPSGSNPRVQKLPLISPAPNNRPRWEGYPIVLSGNVNLDAGETNQPNLELLQTRNDSPMVIEEIVFQITPPAIPPTFLGADISARITLHGEELTNGFVPLCLLGTPYNDVFSDWAVGDGPSYQGLYNAASTTWFEYYRWVLPKPIFVPAGWHFAVQFQRFTLTVGTDANVDVALIGRSLPIGTPIPPSIDIPYATAFVRRAASPTAFQSQEGNFKNPYTVPLYVQRFVQRAKTPGAVSGDEVCDGDLRIVGPSSNPTQVEVTKMFIPGEILTDFSRRAWIFNTILPPDAAYTVVVSGFAATKDFLMSMVGHREVKI